MLTRRLASLLASLLLVAPTLQSTCSQPLSTPESASAQNTTNALATASSDGTQHRTISFIALDKEGRPVTDLKIEEVRLLEDQVEQKTTSLSSTSNEPLTLGLYFDISGSRRADRFIRDEAKLTSEFVHSIWHEGDTAFVVTFNDDVFVNAQPTRRLEDIDRALEKIPQAECRSSTALYDALCEIDAKKLIPLPGRRVYVAFSDFEDNSSRNRLERVVEVAHEAGTQIFPIILGENVGELSNKKARRKSSQQAQIIATETGGEVLVPDSGKQLPAVFRRLSDDLRATYRITYESSTPAPDHKTKKKKILLELLRPQVKLIY